ncbi:MAG: hypothetical protein QNJ40_23350 [Xanthomonadales bacterium]|nr:hypothetical protein [Xanthomonadales bacterium]
MRRIGIVVVGFTVLMAMIPSPLNAQKGMGDQAGVAQQAVKPEVTRMSGTILEVQTGACENTTGKYPIGSHVLIQSGDETYNVHLGPANAVDHVTAQLSVGTDVSFEVFRTDTMPADAVIAKSLTLGDRIIHLRDENLRPSWAYPRGAGRKTRPGAREPCW